MPQISPMSWSLLFLFFSWTLVSVMIFISFESKTSYYPKVVMLLTKSWNW